MLSGELGELLPALRALVAAVLREARNHPDVEDCVNETMRRAIEGRQRLEAGRALAPWLFGIGRHVALDLHRERRRRRRRGDDEPASARLIRLAAPDPTPDVALERARRTALAQHALDQLPEKQRRALVLFHLEGLDYSQIADELNVPMGTVGTWILRGRRRIAQAVKGGGES